MNDTSFFIDIILFAMIAAFLVLRLRSVLGRRDGHDGSGHRDQFSKRQAIEDAKKEKDLEDENVIPLPNNNNNNVDIDPSLKKDTKTENNNKEGPSPLDEGISEIRKHSPSFDVDDFHSGALVAFEMILGSFSEGDKEKLKPLLELDVYSNFEKAIEERKLEEEELVFTLISVKSSNVVEAYMSGTVANVTIKFISEQIIFQGNIGRIRDIKIHEDTGELYMLSDKGELWRMYK